LTHFLVQRSHLVKFEEEKKRCMQKYKNHYFSKSGGGAFPCPLPNDVPGLGKEGHNIQILSFAVECRGLFGK